MNLTFIQDYSTDIRLDNELMGIPDSGMYWNQGVHPLINIANVIEFLPYQDFTIADYVPATEYSKWGIDHLPINLVNYEGIIYQSLDNSNQGNQPDTSPLFWLPTNLYSIRLKIFLKSVERNMTGALQLNRKILENQYIYHVGENLRTLPNDYAGWVIEPKGSDYVTIRINELALQATSAGPVTVSIINQGVIIDTIDLTTNNGRLVFQSVNKEISGKGKFYFVFDSQEVKSDSAYNDPLKYDTFVAYPVIGIGATPEGSSYSESGVGNGLNFNITAYLDSSKYIENNLIDLGDMLRTQFEYDVIRMFLTNSNNVSSGRERNITDNERTMQLIGTEAFNTEAFTIASKYKSKVRETKESINKTLDRFLRVPAKFKVKRRTLG